jgi:hypothetical protein
MRNNVRFWPIADVRMRQFKSSVRAKLPVELHGVHNLDFKDH